MSQILDPRVRRFQAIKRAETKHAKLYAKLEEFRHKVAIKVEELKAQGGKGPHLENIAKGLIFKEQAQARKAVR